MKLFRQSFSRCFQSETLFSIASRYNASKLAERAADLERIRAQLTNAPQEKAEELAKVYEALSFRQLSLQDPAFEQKHRHREAEFKIPFAHELNSTQWKTFNGLELLYRSLEHFDIVPTLLQSSQLASLQLNLAVAFGKDHSFVKRGNLINPWEVLEKPSVLSCLLGNEALEGAVSLLLLDLDYPCTKTGKKIAFCLWKLEEIANDGEKLLFDSPSTKETVPFLAPHPFRGTDYHRFAFLLVQGVNAQFLQERKFDFASIGQQSKMLGISFFRTTWSKHTGEYLNKTIGKDPVFGTVASIFLNEDPKPSKFKYS